MFFIEQWISKQFFDAEIGDIARIINEGRIDMAMKKIANLEQLLYFSITHTQINKSKEVFAPDHRAILEASRP